MIKQHKWQKDAKSYVQKHFYFRCGTLAVYSYQTLVQLHIELLEYDKVFDKLRGLSELLGLYLGHSG